MRREQTPWPAGVLLVCLAVVPCPLESAESHLNRSVENGPAALARIVHVNPVAPGCDSAPRFTLSDHVVDVEDDEGLLRLTIALGPSVAIGGDVVNWPLNLAGEVLVDGKTWAVYQESFRGSVPRLSYDGESIRVLLPVSLMGDDVERLGELKIECRLDGSWMKCNKARFELRRTIEREAG